MWTAGLWRSNRAADCNPVSGAWLSTLTYRSRATAPVSDLELQELVRVAQDRNRAESITGMVIYDGERFFQWLEGPAEALSRVMHSISHDIRHTDIQILGEAKTPVRMFEGWDLKLRRKHSAVDPVAVVGNGARAFSEARDPCLQPSALAASVAAVSAPSDKPGSSCPAIPAMEVDPRASKLALLLISPDPEDASRFITEISEQVESPRELIADLFEPAARCLGDLWSADRCTEFDVTIGLCHLQSALRRLSYRHVRAPLRCHDPNTVLVVPQPGEMHMLCAAFSSEAFWQAGWDTHFDFPPTDEALQDLVANEWFDALDLSLSAAFRREHWLPRIAKTISGARAASRNPAVLVVIGGRLFAERPELGALVGADRSIVATDVVEVISGALRRQVQMTQGV